MLLGHRVQHYISAKQHWLYQNQILPTQSTINQPWGQDLALSVKLHPRYLIHPILYHLVQIHSNYTNMLQCLWKYPTLHGLHCHINSHIWMHQIRREMRRWTNEIYNEKGKVTTSLSCSHSQLPPELQHHKLTYLSHWQSCYKEGLTSVSAMRKEIW